MAWAAPTGTSSSTSSRRPAVRLLSGGQFPWWNPWCRGGFPLAAEPQIGAVSMATPLILALGTSRGMQIATVLCYGIAVEGAYRLAWHWLRDPWAAAMAALVYGLNGAVSVNVAGGYGIVMSYCSLPWLAYHACRIGEGLLPGHLAGFLGSLRAAQRHSVCDPLRACPHGGDLAASAPRPASRITTPRCCGTRSRRQGCSWSCPPGGW